MKRFGWGWWLGFGTSTFAVSTFATLIFNNAILSGFLAFFTGASLVASLYEADNFAEAP